MGATTALRTLLATAAALLGFAANSLLCRAALGNGAIDAWTFTAVRLGSGAGALVLCARLAARGGAAPATLRAGSFPSALALWGYAAAFSLAYLRLGAGVGALVLFASVQATMIGWSAWRGARPSARERNGFVLAFAGLVVLTLPGASLPDPTGLALMAVAGIAWGVYSLRGRTSAAPLLATRDNFVLAAPLALGALLAAVTLSTLHASARGLALALASGALASGLGYALWYRALPRLTAVRAALVQLLVPVLAAAAGILLLDEHLTWRLGVAGPLILLGVGLAVLGRRSGP
ncbi:MAG TPA: DMT family transporter [Planctomycetota bacterium]